MDAGTEYRRIASVEAALERLLALGLVARSESGYCLARRFPLVWR